MPILKKDRFLEQFNISESELTDYNISWDALDEIYDNFLGVMGLFQTQADFVSNILRTNKKIHTVRSRVKDPEHLIAKIIRKTPNRKKELGDDFHFNTENYRDQITDLLGIRAIHIFKEDWEDIHSFIKSTWKVKETTANVRDGDNTEHFEQLGINIDPRKTGYRSVHYLIEFQPTNQTVVAEIQVRTIFEEGYGEIDHLLRYPHNQVPEVLALNLLLFNRIAGSADEMASFINLLKKSWTDMENNYESIIKEKNSEIDILKGKINKNTKLEKVEKESLLSSLDKINFSGGVFEIPSWLNKYEKIDSSKYIADIPSLSSFMQQSGTIQTQLNNLKIKNINQIT